LTQPESDIDENALNITPAEMSRKKTPKKRKKHQRIVFRQIYERQITVRAHSP
jgi:hypothetical protein